MSPGKMSTSLAAAVDSSSIASISSTSDTDDGNQIKDEPIKSELTENVNVRKTTNGTETIAIAIGIGIGAVGDKCENVFRTKTNEERIKQEVSDIELSSLSVNELIAN